MAIILDEKINSAPVIEGRIGGGHARITMGGMGDAFKMQEDAKDLVAVLRTGALPAPLKKTFETQVGPTLGKDAVDKAKFSMIIGSLVVILFMLIYYRVSGLIADIAMVLNIIYQLAILAALGRDLDAARHRRRRAHRRYGRRRQHHHLRTHPRGAACR